MGADWIAGSAGCVLGAILLVLAGCGGQRGGDNGATAAEPTSCEVTADARLSIATGNTTGVYYALGGAYAEAINQQTGGKLKATAAETSASLQNIQQLVAGTHQVAFSLADTAADAVNGMASFDGKQPIAALTRLYPNYTQVIARSRRGHQLDRRHAGQAGVHRIAELRNRGHRQPHVGGRRARPEQGRPGPAHRTR